MTDSEYKKLGGFPIDSAENPGGTKAAIKQMHEQGKQRKRVLRWERRVRRGEAIGKAGDQIAQTGKALFWLGLSLLFVIFVSVPILIHLFGS